MRDIYGISYILFHHGTILHRRLKVVLDEFLYRTILLLTVQMLFFIISGFSTVLPYKPLFFASQVAIITPIAIFFEGIMHMDYGYGIFHRIFGEYKFNKVHTLSLSDFTTSICYAFFDALLITILQVSWILAGSSQDLLVDWNGHELGLQATKVFNSLTLAMMFYFRNRI